MRTSSWVAVLAAAILFSASCQQPSAEFIGTRSEAPLDGTVWQHKTGEDADQFLLFEDGEISLFYGLLCPEWVEYWGDLYTAPYGLKNGLLVTELEWPLMGQPEKVQRASVIRTAGEGEIYLDIILFRYAGVNLPLVEVVEMTIFAPIAPFMDDGVVGK